MKKSTAQIRDALALVATAQAATDACKVAFKRAFGEVFFGEAAHRAAKHFLFFAQFEIHGDLPCVSGAVPVCSGS